MRKVNFGILSHSSFSRVLQWNRRHTTLSRFDQKIRRWPQGTLFRAGSRLLSPMTSVMQVLRRATPSATKHFVVRLDEGSEGTPGTIAGRRREDTIECWRIRRRDAVRLFLYRDHPRSLSYNGNGDLTRQ